MPAAAAADYASRTDYIMRPVELMVQVQVQDNKQHQNRRDDLQTSDGGNPSTVCDYRSAPNAAEHETFVRNAVQLMLEQAVFHGTDRRRPVLNWKSPEELQALFDFKLNREATTHGHLLHLIENTIEHSVKTGHPYFINQLFSRYCTSKIIIIIIIINK